MMQFDYPIKLFNGPALDIFPAQLLESGLKFFDERIAFEHGITGETGIDGVLLDFNVGLRLQIPEGNWHVRISDYQSDVVFVDEDISGVVLISREKFFVHWEIALWLDGEPVFYHQFDPRGARVHFLFTKAIGDNIALLPYVEQFRRKFDCRVSCTMPPHMREIVRLYYPNVELADDLHEDSYAAFYMAAWSNMPFAASHDFRTVPLEYLGKTILCSPLIDQPSKVIYRPTKPREINEPYVCIGVQASGTNKCWLAPDGWDCVVEHLKAMGYRVLCIDRDRKCSGHGMTVETPAGAEDFSGSYDLIDRINQLAYADFFIGISSGLSWLAWSVDIPVVMINSITEPWHEFNTPYHVSNPMVCHGCLNDMRVDFSRVGGCVSYKDSARKYECSKQISARQVIDAIERLIADHNLDGRN